MKHPRCMILMAALVAACLGAPAWAQYDATQTPSDQPSTTTTSPSDTTGTTATTPSTTSSDMGKTGSDTSKADGELPSTATPLWLLGIFGGWAMMGVAGVLRYLRLRRA